MECPYCKAKYRIDPSAFSGWKSARVRCRKCGNGFTIAFPDQGPPETPTETDALDPARETPEPVFVPGPLPPVSGGSPPKPTCRPSLPSAGSLEGLAAEEEPDSALSASRELPSASHREEDLLPFPQVPPEDSSGTHPPHPGEPAGDDAFPVPPVEASRDQVPQEGGNPAERPWDQSFRPWYWSLLGAIAIIVACGLAVAGLFWIIVTDFLPR